MGWSWSCFSKSRRLPSHRQPPVPTPPWPHTSIPVLGQSLNYSSLFLHTCARFIFIPVNLHFLILFMWNSLIFWCWKGRLFPRSNQPHSSSWFLSFMPLLFLSVSLIYWGSLFFRALSDYFPSGFCSNEILNLWDWFFFFPVRIALRKNPVVRDRLFTAVLAGAFAHGFYLVYPLNPYICFYHCSYHIEFTFLNLAISMFLCSFVDDLHPLFFKFIFISKSCYVHPTIYVL